YSQHAGMVIVADGTDTAARRLEGVLITDCGSGVMRHADVGYDLAIRPARDFGLKLSMLPITPSAPLVLQESAYDDHIDLAARGTRSGYPAPDLAGRRATGAARTSRARHGCLGRCRAGHHRPRRPRLRHQHGVRQAGADAHSR